MSTYSLSTTIKCTKGKNLASRTISDLFPYDSTKYATITSISRKDGIYCKTGSSSSSIWATFYVTAQLLIGGIAYITLDPIAGKSCGTGPSSENYVTTTFEGFTQEQSNALVAAWAAGTLSIQWTLSGGRGSNKPYFRDDGSYSDTISINGEDVPPVVYAPTVDLFTIARQSDTSTKADVTIKLSIDASADLNNARLKLFYAENDEPDTVSGTYLSLSAYIQRCVEAAETGYAISLTDDYGLSSDWHFVLVFQIGYEQGKSAIRTLNRSSVPIHIAKSNTGVAIGGYSLPADGETRIDLYWPVYAHAGIEGNTPTIQRGSEAAVETSSGKYATFTVTFETPFAEGVTPVVVVSPTYSGTISYYLGRCGAHVISVSNAGFTAIVANYTGVSGDYPFGLNWIAIA